VGPNPDPLSVVEGRGKERTRDMQVNRCWERFKSDASVATIFKSHEHEFDIMTTQLKN